MEINPFTATRIYTPSQTIQRDHEYVLENNEKVYTDIKYTRYIPFRALDKNIPLDAPCFTKVRTIQWKGTTSDKIQVREEYLNALRATVKLDDLYWLSMGEDVGIDDATTWVRICPKRKHSDLWQIKQIPGIPEPTRIFDNEVFFPELHTLVPIKPQAITSENHN